MRTKRQKAGFTMIEILVALAIIMVLTTLFYINIQRARERGKYGGCVANLKNISTALNMYANDNANRFPTALTMVTPQYVSQIPTCPAVGYNTYLNGYGFATNPDAYTVVCRGSNHTQLQKPQNFPQYSNSRGLIEQ